MSTAPHRPASSTVDDDLELLTEQLQALKQLAEQEENDSGQVYTVGVRWGVALSGRLPRLAYYSSLRLLDDADEARYQALCEELRSLSGQIDRFKFARPVFTVPPAAKAKRHGAARHANSRRGLLRRG